MVAPELLKYKLIELVPLQKGMAAKVHTADAAPSRWAATHVEWVGTEVQMWYREFKGQAIEETARSPTVLLPA